MPPKKKTAAAKKKVPAPKKQPAAKKEPAAKVKVQAPIDYRRLLKNRSLPAGVITYSNFNKSGRPYEWQVGAIKANATANPQAFENPYGPYTYYQGHVSDLFSNAAIMEAKRKLEQKEAMDEVMTDAKLDYSNPNEPSFESRIKGQAHEYKNDMEMKDQEPEPLAPVDARNGPTFQERIEGKAFDYPTNAEMEPEPGPEPDPVGPETEMQQAEDWKDAFDMKDLLAALDENPDLLQELYESDPLSPSNSLSRDRSIQDMFQRLEQAQQARNEEVNQLVQRYLRERTVSSTSSLQSPIGGGAPALYTVTSPDLSSSESVPRLTGAVTPDRGGILIEELSDGPLRSRDRSYENRDRPGRLLLPAPSIEEVYPEMTQSTEPEGFVMVEPTDLTDPEEEEQEEEPSRTRRPAPNVETNDFRYRVRARQGSYNAMDYLRPFKRLAQ